MEFPDYLRIIPPSAESHALLERSALAQALARLEAVLDPGLLAVPLVGIAWRQGDARVALTLPTQPNAAADTLAAETTGQARVAISLSQFSEILGELASEQICIGVVDGQRPVLITDPADDSLLLVQLPMKWRRANEPVLKIPTATAAKRAAS